MRIEVRCPAKINLSLKVLPPDATEMHPIQTELQAIALYDELTIQDGVESTSITCDWPGLPTENTLSKCLRMVSEARSVPPLEIQLVKRIPAESGLGGGSSDAAGLIRALRKILPLPIGSQLEFEIAAAVGADVPFFLVGGRALGEGYGERLTPLEDAARCWLVIARPEVGVSTAAAYAALDSTDRTPRDSPLVNDFELVAPRECEELKAKLLGLGAASALLCGSGSAVFGQFGTEEEAIQAANKIGVQTWVAPSLTREESLWIS